MKRPAVHDHAITDDAPSTLRATYFERTCGVPSMTQSGRIGSRSRSISAGTAKTGRDMEAPLSFTLSGRGDATADGTLPIRKASLRERRTAGANVRRSALRFFRY